MTETQIIAALANACGLKWARCHICGERPASCFGKYESMSEREPSCDDCCGHACEDGHCDQLREMTLEAWQAEWAAEHPGEPGPVREWTSEDGRVRWATTDGCFVSITVGQLQAVRWMHVPGWAVGQDDDCTSADVADLARLMAAVDKAGA